MSTDAVLVSMPLPGVALLRISRPAVLNALNLSARKQIAATVESLDDDESIRVIVLAGYERAFCAGADLNEYVDAGPVEIVERDMGRLWGSVSGCRKPMIAAVRGYALGGGCELAMHADLIIAGKSAQFGQPEILIGLMPGGGATQRLTRAVGKFRAMKLLLTGESVSATLAFDMGLISEVVDDAQVEPRALELAARMASLPALALRFIKQAVLESMNGTLESGLEFERKSFQLLFATSDKSEGIRARLERRDPCFGKSERAGVAEQPEGSDVTDRSNAT